VTWKLVILKEEYHKCFNKWPGHYNHCVQSVGDYFEGDEFNICNLLFLQKKETISGILSSTHVSWKQV